MTDETLKVPDRRIIAGDNIKVVVRTRPKPWWIPGFVWSWMVKTVILERTISGSVAVVREPQL